MREIKFRAWHKDSGWQHDIFIHPNGKPVEFQQMDGSAYPHLESFDVPDIILEQYTGLKDKNGKEIYEGDILALDGPFFHGPRFIGKLVLIEGSCGPCKGINAFQYVLENKKHGKLYNLWRTDTIEVIGNIHENPELLESGE